MLLDRRWVLIWCSKFSSDSAIVRVSCSIFVKRLMREEVADNEIRRFLIRARRNNSSGVKKDETLSAYFAFDEMEIDVGMDGTVKFTVSGVSVSHQR